MRYLEITLRTETSASELIAQVLVDHGCGGAVIYDRDDPAFTASPDAWAVPDPSIREAMDEDVLVVGYLPEDRADAVTAIERRVAELRRIDLGGIDLGKATVSVALIDEDDWAHQWKRYYKPLHIGRRLVIKPSWEAYEPQPGEIVLEIDPGMAFGTGTHETTALCLRLLEDCIVPGSGQTVFDAGCGSGILSMAAALLGASRVTAGDIDPSAVKVAVENIGRGGFSDRVAVRRCDLLVDPVEPADLIVANIIADVIIGAAGKLAGALNPGGALIASGIIRDREEDVLSALARAGMSAARTERAGEWIAVLARRDRG